MPMINVNTAVLFSKLGLEPAYQKIELAGIKMIFTSTGLKFSKGTVLANAPVSAAKAADVVSGHIALPDPVAQSIKSTLSTAATQALNGVNNSAAQAASTASAAAAQANEPSAGAGHTIVVSNGVVPQFQGDIHKAPCVPLKDATKLLQPVNGTDALSRYYAIGIGPWVNLGVRVMDTKLSIRLEGQTGAHAVSINKTELFSKISLDHDKHVSCHLQVHSRMEVRRVLGALFATLPLFNNSMPDLTHLYPAGLPEQAKDAA